MAVYLYSPKLRHMTLCKALCRMSQTIFYCYLLIEFSCRAVQIRENLLQERPCLTRFSPNHSQTAFPQSTWTRMSVHMTQITPIVGQGLEPGQNFKQCIYLDGFIWARLKFTSASW